MRWLPVVLLLVGCRTTAPVASAGACPAGAPRRGEVLTLPDGSPLWFERAGPRDAPAVVFLHGGPGYNAVDFERSVMPRLSQTLQVISLDQPGCGRSWAPGARRLGLEGTVAALEALREHLRLEKVILLAHSFGGAVALGYLHAHQDHVAGLVLVETTADFPRALQQQLDTLARLAPERFPAHAAALSRLAQADAPVLERLGQAWGELGRVPVQRALQFATAAAQEENDRWDEEAGLLRCDAGPVVQAWSSEGFFTRGRLEWMAPLPVPAVLFGGRQSHVIGAALLEQTAQAWGVPLVWFEQSGHFPFLEEPDRFIAEVRTFVARTPTADAAR